MSINPVSMTPELYDYLRQNSLRESEAAKQLREETAKMPGAQMISAPEVSQFLALLIKLISAKKVIEVGTFTGYSTLVMAEALPEEGKLITIDVSPEAPQVGVSHWQQAKVSQKIELVIAPALTVLDELILQGAQDFDLAYIDADKKNNQEYYEKLLTLLRPRGLIVIDNVLFSGRVLEAHPDKLATVAIKAFNEFLLTDERISLSMLPVADGITLACKN